jgi:putative chitinase
VIVLSRDQLAAIMPYANADRWTDPLNEAMARYSINTPERVAAFLAHVAHESDECRCLTENLRYTATGLCRTWPKRFPSLELAAPYANNPEAIANYVYANRLGNGDTASGDGWRFRGRGLIQLTGRTNYTTAGDALGLYLATRPELLEEWFPAALTAAWFWESRGCNALADSQAGDDAEEDFKRITQIINGGTHGLAARRAYWYRAQGVVA